MTLLYIPALFQVLSCNTHFEFAISRTGISPMFFSWIASCRLRLASWNRLSAMHNSSSFYVSSFVTTLSFFRQRHRLTFQFLQCLRLLVLLKHINANPLPFSRSFSRVYDALWISIHCACINETVIGISCACQDPVTLMAYFVYQIALFGSSDNTLTINNFAVLRQASIDFSVSMSKAHIIYKLR